MLYVCACVYFALLCKQLLQRRLLIEVRVSSSALQSLFYSTSFICNIPELHLVNQVLCVINSGCRVMYSMKIILFLITLMFDII